MARIVLGSYMARYPLGGMMSWVLQYLVGFARLGHDVYFVERADYPDACFDPRSGEMTDDGAYGAAVVEELLASVGLGARSCFVDHRGRRHGLEGDVFAGADLFVDMGTHGAWAEEARAAGLRVLIDGEPGFTQAKMERAGGPPADYDAYYTTGRNIGTAASDAPTAGRDWRPIFHPVAPELFEAAPAPAGAPFTTVMNWRSHDRVEWRGRLYGHKDLEFERFRDLPGLVDVPLEAAVAGAGVPAEDLRARGWRLRDAHATTMSFDGFRDYLRDSAGEFGVCKQAFVSTWSGWFSDRSVCYLASGRPVIAQDTGFSDWLATGSGVLSYQTAEQAAAALDELGRDYRRHSRAARQLAEDVFDSDRVLTRLLACL